MDRPSFSPPLIGRIIPISPSRKDESGDWRTRGDNEVADLVTPHSGRRPRLWSRLL